MKTTTALHLLNPGFEARARAFREAGVLNDTELLVVDSVAPRFGVDDPEVLLGLAFALRAPRRGHVGVDLRALAAATDVEGLRPTSDEGESPVVALDWPASPEDWQRAVLDSALVGAAEDEGAPPLPFVAQSVEGGRTLVLSRRMWCEQRWLADALLARSGAAPALPVPPALLEDYLREAGLQDEAAQAVRLAATRALSIVTGGPGTGKTFSIKRLLALLLKAWPPEGERPLRIELAAPTGKAAVRMGEAMGEKLETVPGAESLRGCLRGLQPRTLHKLLGMRPDGSARHGRNNPLPADVVVVDEVSMVDLALMRKLLDAVPEGARLILLGDRDQLASVEAGCVLADLVRDPLRGRAEAPLTPCVAPFTRSHRFEQAPSIAHLAAELQRNDDSGLDRVLRILQGEDEELRRLDPDGVHHLGLPEKGRPTTEQLAALAAPYLDETGYAGRLARLLTDHGASGSALRSDESHGELLAALEGYRVLATHRRGPLGVSGLDRAIGALVRGHLSEALQSHRPGAALPARAGCWLGQPLLILENAYDVGLMNGDIGLVLPGAEGLTAVFPVTREGLRGTRQVALARLPAYQGALAMTVHKSQGSQFAHVALVLAGRASPIQTRELVYTAITRSSRRLSWLGDPSELRAALDRRVQRASGLADLLV